MAVRLSPGSSSAVVEVPDDLVERYKANGWVAVSDASESDTEPEGVVEETAADESDADANANANANGEGEGEGEEPAAEKPPVKRGRSAKNDK